MDEAWEFFLQQSPKWVSLSLTGREGVKVYSIRGLDIYPPVVASGKNLKYIPIARGKIIGLSVREFDKIKEICLNKVN